MSSKKKAIKKAFNDLFILYIVLPVAIIFIFVLILAGYYVKKSAIDNISLVHETMSSIISNEVNDMSLRLSHLLYANNEEILSIASSADTDNTTNRYNAELLLEQNISYTFSPTSQILALYFYFKSGRDANYKTDIKYSIDDIKELDIYTYATLTPNVVKIHGFNSGSVDKLYMGQNSHNLVYLAGLKPNRLLDHVGNIDFVALFQISKLYNLILTKDNEYNINRNKIGYTALYNDDTKEILSYGKWDLDNLSSFINGNKDFGYTYVSTSLEDLGLDWTIVSKVHTYKLYSGFFLFFLLVLLTVVFLLSFSIIFNRLLMKNIIFPIQSVSEGLKRVEEGDMGMHIDAAGYLEIRGVIHSFNAMVRRVKALFDEYENDSKQKGKTPEQLLSLIVSGQADVQKLNARDLNFFSEAYKLFILSIFMTDERIETRELEKLLDTNLHFSSRCTMSKYSNNQYVVHMRIELI